MPFPDCVPELTDGVVRLRAHRREDAERIVEQCQNVDTLRWTTVPRPYGPAEAEWFLKHIEDGWNAGEGYEYWAITDAADPQQRFLGTIDLRAGKSGMAEVGFGLHPDGRGRGLMAAALRLVAARFFNDLGGQRLYWWASRGNFASWRVAWACGFTFHATLPARLQPPDPSAQSDDGWVASVGRDDDLTRPDAPWHEPVTLEADGIRLRAWRPDDVEAIELDDTPEHFEPPGARQTPENYAEWLLRRQERMSQGTSTWWCITDAATDRALGLVTLIEGGQEPGTAELGYALFPSARGRGATTIASRLVVDYAFAETGGRGLRKLSALTVGDNDKSAAVLTRLGFTEWGREPAFCEREDGTLDDARHWVLLRP